VNDDAIVVVLPDGGRVVPRRFGEHTVIKAAESETAGAYAVRANSVPAGFGEVPLHIHRFAEEAFYVIDGELTVIGDERSMAAPAGSFVVIRRGTVHALANRGAVPLRWLTMISPAWVSGWIEEESEHPERRDEIYAKYGLEIVGPPPPADAG
jgi:mannose-6-phosphate isomerase-like protein (cupin superfamily)